MEQKYIDAFKTYVTAGTYQAVADQYDINWKTAKIWVNKVLSDPEYAVFVQSCYDNGVDPNKVSHFWVKTDNVSMFVKNGEQETYENFRERLMDDIEKAAPVLDPYKREDLIDPHLLVIDPADVHIGKYASEWETGSTYNCEVALQRVIDSVVALVEKATAACQIVRLVSVVGNDILHIEHPHRKTTAGTPQDTDGQWWEMFLLAKRIYIGSINELIKHANVHVVFCPSNHDFVSGWMLADTIYSWFRKNENVSFGEDQRNVSIAHRKYILYGTNLIGFTHGDGAKEKDLPNLMQLEAREAWGQSKFSYWYVHHLHHKIRNVIGKESGRIEKDHTGVTVMRTSGASPAYNTYIETVRSPSPADSWHDRNGYKTAQAVEAFVHHPEYGQVARFTYNF